MKKGNATKALIYDDNCPLCKAYTSAFVKGGLLEQKNRLAFTEINMQQFHIDWHRAKHEIPLVDIETGKVWYGVEALTEVLEQKLPFIKGLLRINFLNWLFHKLYKLVSYNRKIIIAQSGKNKSGFDCTPDYSYTWRWILFVIAIVLSFFFIKVTHLLPVLFTGITFIKNITVIILLFLVLLFLTAGKKLATELFVHGALALMISSFLLLTTVLLKKICSLETWSYHALLILVLLATAYQVYKRINFMINKSQAET